MTNQAKIDWTAWNAERREFRDRDSQGFDADCEALEKHIKTLRDVAPKDSAGWMNSRCIVLIERLRRDLYQARVFAGTMKPGDTEPQD